MDKMAETIARRENANGVRAFVAVGRFLEQEGWYPQQVEDAPIYQMSFSGEGGPITCYAQVRVEEEILLCYAVAPVRVEEAARPAVAEFVTRANYGLWTGNFEMDWDDGEVRYKSSLDFEGVALTPELIRNAISPAVQMMVCYLPGLLSVIGGRSPAETLAQVDADCNCGE
jgi:hypothetical protein